MCIDLCAICFNIFSYLVSINSLCLVYIKGEYSVSDNICRLVHIKEESMWQGEDSGDDMIWRVGHSGAYR